MRKLFVRRNSIFVSYLTAVAIAIFVAGSLYMLGVSAAIAEICGWFSLVIYGALDIWFSSVDPHRRFHRRNQRVRALLAVPVDKRPPHHWAAICYLLGLNQYQLHRDKRLLTHAIEMLIAHGIDPKTIDEGK